MTLTSLRKANNSLFKLNFWLKLSFILPIILCSLHYTLHQGCNTLKRDTLVAYQSDSR